MFERKKDLLERVAWGGAALIVAAGTGSYLAMPGVPIGAAHAHTAALASSQIAYHGRLRHGGIPLEDLRNAEDRLDSVPVRNSHGDPVGFVHDVVVGRGGRPKLVHVGFGGMFGIGARIVPIKADALGYDPKHKVILTDMTVKELQVIAAHRASQEN